MRVHAPPAATSNTSGSITFTAIEEFMFETLTRRKAQRQGAKKFQIEKQTFIAILFPLRRIFPFVEGSSCIGGWGTVYQL
jgi:hypothetical protein